MRIIGVLNHYLLSAIIIGLIIFWLIKVLEIIIKKIKKAPIEFNLTTCIFQLIFIIYLVGVSFVTGAYLFFIDGFSYLFMSPNLVPLVNTIQDFSNHPVEVTEQIGYNVVLFVPFGFLVPYCFPHIKWGWKRILLLSLIVILTVEGLEFFSGRYFDIDDLIVNGLGALLGYLAQRIINSKHLCLFNCASTASGKLKTK